MKQSAQGLHVFWKSMYLRLVKTDYMFDVNFNFFTEITEIQDPDEKSTTPKRYNKILWSKSLPIVKIFNLDEDSPELSKNYLYHKSELGYFVFGSEAITHIRS